MNNYQRMKAKAMGIETAVLSTSERIMARLAELNVNDDELMGLLADYSKAFEAAKAKTGSVFDELFPEIGAEITRQDAFAKTEGKVAIDARQCYQWRKRGYNVERVKDEAGEPTDTYRYVSFDEAKHAEWQAAEKAKRQAKKSA